jgi:large subunit ribosomal protein L35
MGIIMKAKTKKSAMKRVKITSSGKMMIGHVNTSHLKTKQSRRTKRRKSVIESMNKADIRRVEQLLPYKRSA